MHRGEGAGRQAPGKADVQVRRQGEKPTEFVANRQPHTVHFL